MADFQVLRWILTLLRINFTNPSIDLINSCKTYKNADESVTSKTSSKAMTMQWHVALAKLDSSHGDS